MVRIAPLNVECKSIFSDPVTINHRSTHDGDLLSVHVTDDFTRCTVCFQRGVLVYQLIPSLYVVNDANESMVTSKLLSVRTREQHNDLANIHHDTTVTDAQLSIMNAMDASTILTSSDDSEACEDRYASYERHGTCLRHAVRFPLDTSFPLSGALFDATTTTTTTKTKTNQLLLYSKSLSTIWIVCPVPENMRIRKHNLTNMIDTMTTTDTICQSKRTSSTSGVFAHTVTFLKRILFVKQIHSYFLIGVENVSAVPSMDVWLIDKVTYESELVMRNVQHLKHLCTDARTDVVCMSSVGSPVLVVYDVQQRTTHSYKCHESPIACVVMQPFYELSSSSSRSETCSEERESIPDGDCYSRDAVRVTTTSIQSTMARVWVWKRGTDDDNERHQQALTLESTLRYAWFSYPVLALYWVDSETLAIQFDDRIHFYNLCRLQYTSYITNSVEPNYWIDSCNESSEHEMTIRKIDHRLCVIRHSDGKIKMFSIDEAANEYAHYSEKSIIHRHKINNYNTYFPARISITPPSSSTKTKTSTSSSYASVVARSLPISISSANTENGVKHQTKYTINKQ